MLKSLDFSATLVFDRLDLTGDEIRVETIGGRSDAYILKLAAVIVVAAASKARIVKCAAAAAAAAACSRRVDAAVNCAATA